MGKGKEKRSQNPEPRTQNGQGIASLHRYGKYFFWDPTSNEGVFHQIAQGFNSGFWVLSSPSAADLQTVTSYPGTLYSDQLSEVHRKPKGACIGPLSHRPGWHPRYPDVFPPFAPAVAFNGQHRDQPADDRSVDALPERDGAGSVHRLCTGVLSAGKCPLRPPPGVDFCAGRLFRSFRRRNLHRFGVAEALSAVPPWRWWRWSVFLAELPRPVAAMT